MPATVNRAYSVPNTGADVGTWGSADLNPNFAAIDTNLGGVSAVALSNVNVTLSPTQYANGTIRVSGALSASVLVLFPNVQGWWTIENLCTGAFTVSARLAAGGNQIGMPQGEAWDVLADGTNMKYRNLPHPIGAYWDDCGTAVPDWVSACTVPPYLLCDGSVFSAVTYPYLNTKLGGTTLPDYRGRIRAYLNGGTGRITTAGSGIDGDTRESAGGGQTVTLARANLTNDTVTVTGTVTPTVNGVQMVGVNGSTPGSSVAPPSGAPVTVYSTQNYVAADAAALVGGISSSINGGVTQTAVNKMPPTCIGGITMIRAGG